MTNGRLSRYISIDAIRRSQLTVLDQTDDKEDTAQLLSATA
jgi:hypothetical protein